LTPPIWNSPPCAQHSPRSVTTSRRSASDRPLADYRKEEVLRLVEVVVDAYQAHMLFDHERMAAKERAFFEQRLAAQPKPQPASGSNTRIPF